MWNYGAQIYFSMTYFLPIENIESLVMIAVDYVGTLNEKILVVIPLVQKIILVPST